MQANNNAQKIQLGQDDLLDHEEETLVAKWQEEHPGEPLTGVSVTQGKKVFSDKNQS
jgi:hypothetical protein